MYGKALVANVVFMAFALVAVADTRDVVIIKGSGRFTIGPFQIARVSVDVPDGGVVKASVDGPARIVSESTVHEATGGISKNRVVAGEAEIEPTGAGRIIVTLTIVPRSGEPSAKVFVFQAEGSFKDDVKKKAESK